LTLALAEFMKAQKFNPNNALLNFKIGVCHLNSTSPFKGIQFINRALKLDPAMRSVHGLLCGSSSSATRSVCRGIKSYQSFENNYKKSDNFAKFVTQRKGQCKFAEQYERNPDTLLG
jgi:hypothetical protein